MTHHPQSVDLKRLLHESKDRHNHSLFDHVCNILHHIDHNHGDVTVEDFENISHFLASTKFAYHQYDPAHFVNNPVAVDEHGLKKHYAKISKLISEVHNDPQSWVQDFSEVNCDWNVAGFGFGEEEAKTLHLVLEKLATKNRCDNISFLGIVNGSSKDYFVAYGRLRQHVNDKLPDSWEKSGTGVNAITFWAANEILGEWVELPAIGPEHITAARFNKHVVTGNLDASVITYPDFKGKEKHYLKTQLVRMLFNCELVPTGMFRPKEDAKEDEKPQPIEIDPEYVLPEAKEDLGKVENWVHYNPQLLKSGRTTHYVPRHITGDAAQDLLAALEEKDPLADRLKSATEDTPVDGGNESAYLTRVYGDRQPYNVNDREGNSTGRTANYEIVVIQSLLWPGFYTIVNTEKQRWSHLYLGLGLKFRQPYIPDKIQDFLAEPKDLTEIPEVDLQVYSANR